LALGLFFLLLSAGQLATLPAMIPTSVVGGGVSLPFLEPVPPVRISSAGRVSVAITS
jgi:hypothetical protein